MIRYFLKSCTDIKSPWYNKKIFAKDDSESPGFLFSFNVFYYVIFLKHKSLQRIFLVYNTYKKVNYIIQSIWLNFKLGRLFSLTGECPLFWGTFWHKIAILMNQVKAFYVWKLHDFKVIFRRGRDLLKASATEGNKTFAKVVHSPLNIIDFNKVLKAIVFLIKRHVECKYIS